MGLLSLIRAGLKPVYLGEGIAIRGPRVATALHRLEKKSGAPGGELGLHNGGRVLALVRGMRATASTLYAELRWLSVRMTEAKNKRYSAYGTARQGMG